MKQVLGLVILLIHFELPCFFSLLVTRPSKANTAVFISYAATKTIPLFFKGHPRISTALDSCVYSHNFKLYIRFFFWWGGLVVHCSELWFIMGFKSRIVRGMNNLLLHLLCNCLNSILMCVPRFSNGVSSNDRTITLLSVLQIWTKVMSGSGCTRPEPEILHKINSPRTYTLQNQPDIFKPFVIRNKRRLNFNTIMEI